MSPRPVATRQRNRAVTQGSAPGFASSSTTPSTGMAVHSEGWGVASSKSTKLAMTRSNPSVGRPRRDAAGAVRRVSRLASQAPAPSSQRRWGKAKTPSRLRRNQAGSEVGECEGGGGGCEQGAGTRGADRPQSQASATGNSR